jgi:hypothetical protein
MRPSPMRTTRMRVEMILVFAVSSSCSTQNRSLRFKAVQTARPAAPHRSKPL